MEIIEKIIKFYYIIKTKLLLFFCLTFIFLTIVLLINLKSKNQNIRYIINKLIYRGIYSTIIVGIGEILCLSGLILKIKYVYFNAFVFILIIAAVIVYEILLCLMFKKILLPVLQNCKYIQFITFLELFLLTITQHLEVLDWVTGTLGIVFIEMIIILLEYLMSKQKEKKKRGKRMIILILIYFLPEKNN